MRAADIFHIGIVVSDLDVELQRLTALLGHRWGPEVDVEQPVHFDAGEQTIRFRFRYSITEPRLELIEARPGSIWVPNESGAGHHIGLWTDDIATAGAQLEVHGYTLEAASSSTAVDRMWAYYLGPGGVRYELVNRSMRDLMAALWT